MTTIVNTKTVCPFPYAAPNGVNATSPADCTITYGEALGAGHIVLQTVLVATGAVGVAVFGYRLWALRTYCEVKHVTYHEHPAFIHFVLCFAFNLFLIIGSFDVFGFWGVMPIRAYAAFDELCAASAITNGLMVVRFLYKMSHNMENPNLRNSTILTNVTVVAVWFNFVGFMIVSLIDYPRYKFYDGLKCLVGAIILLVFLLIASIYAHKLRQYMMRMASQVNDRTRLERHLRILRIKHLRFSAILVFSCIALLANAALSITAEDLTWTLVIDELPDPSQIAFRVAYILNTIVTISLFRVPSLSASGSSRETAMSSPTSPYSKSNDKVVPATSYEGTDGPYGSATVG